MPPTSPSRSTMPTVRADPAAEGADGGVESEAATSDAPASPPRPPRPETLDDTGLDASRIGSLILKILYVKGDRTGQELSEVLGLPFSLIDDVVLRAQHERFVQVLRSEGSGRPAFLFSVTERGRARAREALAKSQYVGPAPVPLEQFRTWIVRQSVRSERYGKEVLEEALSDLVLDDEIVSALGPAVNSGESLFLYGEPGNGKTAIAERIGRMVSGELYLPHAVDVDGRVMMLFDPVYHEPIPDGGPADASAILRPVTAYDRRFVRIRRPAVMVGGELTLEQLDLEYDHESGIYHAPFQLKASGGVLVIDDFGRQQVRPEDLLNRWIVPLEKQVDFLSLHTGTKFPVPFDCLLVFSTNLDPNSLVDEAFLRRIQHKVEVTSPDRRRFERIFRDVCARRDLDYEEEALEHLWSRYYEELGIPPRGCHPRDVLKHLEAIARFEEVDPELSRQRVDRAAERYFEIMRPDYAGRSTDGGDP